MSASAYYRRATGERSAREVEDERLTARIRQVHGQNFECYGSPRVWHELRASPPRAGPYSVRAAGAIGNPGESQRLGGRGQIGLTLSDAVIWVIAELQIGTAAFFPGRYGGQARPTGRVDADS
ncbi:MAG TPA: IS3 family transposase [Solirubrobacteraceae bacterium]